MKITKNENKTSSSIKQNTNSPNSEPPAQCVEFQHLTHPCLPHLWRIVVNPRPHQLGLVREGHCHRHACFGGLQVVCYPQKSSWFWRCFPHPPWNLHACSTWRLGAFQKWSSIWMPHMRVYTARSIQYSLIQTTMLTCTKCAWNFGPNSSPTAAGPGEPRPKKAALWVFNLQVETWHILRGWPSPQNEIFHQNCTPTKRAKMHPFL